MLPLWAYGVGGAVLLTVGAAGGWTVRDWKADSDTLAAKVAADKAREAAVKAAYDASASFEGERATIQVQAAEARSTVREIYRDVKVPTDCAVPAAGVSVLDRAISPDGADTGKSGVPVPSDPSAARPAD